MQNLRTFLILFLLFLPTSAIAQTGGSPKKVTRSMTEIFSHLKNSSYEWPEIHSSTFCTALPSKDSNACIAGNKEGMAYYEALSTYHTKLSRMPIGEFSIEITKLAQLRDQLWKKGVYGNVLLANLIDKIIFWRIVERISLAPQKDLPQVSKLLLHYRALSKDWPTVVRAIEIERSKKLDRRKLNNNQELGYLYLEVLEQVRSLDKNGITMGMADFTNALNRLDADEFVSTFLQSPPRSKSLHFYYQIRLKVGIFPSSKGQNIVIDKTKEFPAVTSTMSRKFQEWFTKYIPTAQKEREFGTTENLRWEDLFDLYEIGRTLNSDPTLPLDLVYF